MIGLLLLPACALFWEVHPHLQDLDGDGVSAAEDCDDGDPSLGGPTAWHADGDGDGYGAAGSQVACGAPSGTVADGSDCDDADAATHPGAPERCDDQDADCDGATRDPESEDATVWWADGDQDGFGDPDNVVRACDAPSGYLPPDPDNADCDDSSSLVHPGAAETCGDGQDQDCDDQDAECLALGSLSLAAAARATLLGQEGGNAGYSLAIAGDVGGDGLDDILVGAPSLEGTTPGMLYVVMGPVTGTLSLADADAALEAHTPSELLGWAVADAGDLDQDGLHDLLAGAPGSMGSWEGSGAAWVLYGSTSGTLSPPDAANLEGPVPDAAMGWAVAGVGDLDGDGYDDLGVGSGSVADAYVFLGSSTRLSGTTSALDADLSLHGEEDGEGFGQALASAGDVNGDGSPDLLVGAPFSDGGNGAAWVFLGPITSSLRATDAAFTFTGPSGAGAGFSVASAGRVGGGDRDGVLVGSADQESAWVLRDPEPGTTPLDLATTTLSGMPGSCDFGTSVTGPGDVDQDGDADLLIGAPRQSDILWSAGAAFLFLDAATDSLSASTAQADYRGYQEYDGAGVVGSGGDVDGDGFPDMLVGAPYNSLGDPAAGAAWLISGNLRAP